MYVAGTYDGFEGVQVFDTSNPVDPTPLGSLSGMQNVQALQVLGGWVSVIDMRAWHLIDWRTTTNALPHGRYPIVAFPEDIQLENDRAYIASEYGGGLQIIDISDLNSLMQLGSYAPIYASSLEVRNNLAYVTNPTDEGGLHIINISSVTNTIQLGRYDNWYREWDVQLVGDLAYVAAEKDGLQIIDISNPSSPTLRGANTTPDNTAYLHVEGQVAYALDDHNQATGPTSYTR